MSTEPLDLVLRALERCGCHPRKSGTGWSARCPAHDDAHASLSLNVGEGGRALLKCHAGCHNKAIVSALGLSLSHLMPNSGDRALSRPKRVCAYDYRDESGTMLYQVIRYSPKGFRQCRPEGKKCVWNLNGVRRVLYRLPELLKADPETVIHIVEGELDVDRLREHHLEATCNPGGAGKWKAVYNTHLEGRPVVVIPDNDAPGRKHAHDVASSLYGTAASLKVLELPGLPDHGDVSDWLNEGHDIEELVRIAETTPEWTPDRAEPLAEAGEKHIDSGVANMERLVAQHHRDVRYLYRVGWYSWDDRRYAPNAEAHLTRRAIRTVRGMYHEAADIENQRERESFLAHIRRSESEPEIRRMLLLAKDHEEIYVPTVEHFDRDPMLFNVQNGTLNLRTRELQPHRREDLLTKLAGCAYDPKADSPTWTAFLETVFDGDQDMIGFVQRLAGYCLTGEVRDHVLPIFWGDGANGKTTLIRTLLNLMGEYGTPAPRDLLVVRKHAAHETELMVLLGARLAAAVETPLGAYLAETLVKNLTGNDAFKARHVFKDFVTIIPTHKVIMATNHKPQIQGTDNAIWRRLLLVPFTVTIAPEDQDVHLLDKLTLELPGVLSWAVQGCKDWQDAGLKPPMQVKVATDSYRQESDHLPVFMEESCVLQPFAKVEKGTIFVEYALWCEKNGESPMPKVELGRRLKALGVTDEKSSGRRYWSGIGLVTKDRITREGQ